MGREREQRDMLERLKREKAKRDTRSKDQQAELEKLWQLQVRFCQSFAKMRLSIECLDLERQHLDFHDGHVHVRDK